MFMITIVVSLLQHGAYVYVQIDVMSQETLQIRMYAPVYLRTLVHSHGIECSRILMEFKQYVTVVYQNEYERYVRFQTKYMGFAWPREKIIHPIVALSIDTVYTVAVFDTLPFMLDRTIDWVAALTELVEHFGTPSSDLLY